MVNAGIDAKDLSEKILALWKRFYMSSLKSDELTKSSPHLPCWTLTENGLDLVKNAYFHPEFGIVIDATLNKKNLHKEFQ